MQSTPSTRRILVTLSSKHPLYASAWEDPEAVVKAALDLLTGSSFFPDAPQDAAPNPRLLVIKRNLRMYLVFDIFHEAYDPTIGHLPRPNDLPVLAVFLYAGDKSDFKDLTAENSPLRKEVNRQVQALHDWEGWGSQPPFRMDYANDNVPTYWHPRTPEGCTGRVVTE